MSDESQESQFDDNPAGWANRWKMELDSARESLKKWQQQGEKIDARFRDERDDKAKTDTRWNYFTANIITRAAMMYGKTPQVNVDRRFADAADDTGRVAGETLERLLNTDIERDGDSYSLALGYALLDFLLPGLGWVRLRYVPQFGEQPAQEAKLGPDGGELAPAVPAAEVKSDEDVETEYVHWKDVLWNSARVWPEVRWVAFRAEMSRKQLVERFGEEKGKAVPLNAPRGVKLNSEDAKKYNPWGRAEVWEIWSKEDREVFWYVDGHKEILDRKPDPLGLEGFWPFPRPMMANLTTSKAIPRPDYVLWQDLYEEVDTLSTRISLLERAIAVRGVYDKSSKAVIGLLSETPSNQLIPIDGWAAFAEKGGIKGAVDWLPLEQIVNAIGALVDQRDRMIETLNQLSGMSDIMRGQQVAGVDATATEQTIKAKFGSIRMQAMQDEFARFASDCQRLKGEIISKHFDARNILARSNIQYTPDAKLGPQAVELIKSRFSHYRIQVKPEAVSLTDFAALKQERSEVLGTMSQFFTAAAPLVSDMPDALHFLLQILQWMVAGVKGGSQIESILDQAIEMAKQHAAQPPQPAQQDPKLQIQQLKGEQDLQKLQAETQAHAVKSAIDVQTEDAKQQSQTEWNVKEDVARERLRAARPAPAPRGFGPGGLP